MKRRENNIYPPEFFFNSQKYTKMLIYQYMAFNMLTFIRKK